MSPCLAIASLPFRLFRSSPLTRISKLRPGPSIWHPEHHPDQRESGLFTALALVSRLSSTHSTRTNEMAQVCDFQNKLNTGNGEASTAQAHTHDGSASHSHSHDAAAEHGHTHEHLENAGEF